jgi:hypothetical protein
MIIALRFLQILPWLAANPLRIKPLFGHKVITFGVIFLSPPILTPLHIYSSNSPYLMSKFLEALKLLG